MYRSTKFNKRYAGGSAHIEHVWIQLLLKCNSECCKGEVYPRILCVKINVFIIPWFIREKTTTLDKILKKNVCDYK